ncbi:uncharacterized protein MELLADRAFT_101049 [Melampsora larici-populina 98AG31]|uniref:Diphthamide biosynthesis protein 4 n=1 Tax=Melampsora larici-populina (strain 98AG31 / pathotype 3-4-7) TaxID=747676 RepID=F4R3G3_MELLP|nr:uncharacterized protein MELLADRAFT_101049 [Melampsora larici-populina 98AG31]EGG12623.1 hypothetical protein MELLADRAFT_101049 [Melampsora larici-populina 98AG31]
MNKCEELCSHYQTLQLTSNASSSEIRQAYLRLIKLSHPDKNQLCGPTLYESSAQRIIEAYAILADQTKREAYDLKLKLDQSQAVLGSKCQNDTRKPIVSHTVDLSEFTEISTVTKITEHEEPVQQFIYSCRCGGQFMITSQDMESKRDIVGCNGCSLTVKVEFEFDCGDSDSDK